MVGQSAVKYLVELITALTPFVTAATPVLLVLVGWWINRQNKKTAAAQTTDLKAHSDENREKIASTVATATGTHPTLKPPDGS